ncbi:MAG TPA: hypothetical protein VHP11_06540 [Tepidisphaeraceae bacterium]|nr:hypothetical protein [Tepidisphaeraceae bacterium]
MPTTMKTNRSLLPLMGLGLLTGLIAGCTHERPAKADPFFPPHEQGVTASVLEAQAARGARMDATLYPAHFTASTLNTLGQAKLALILTDRADTLPLTIYLDLPANDPQAAGTHLPA